MSDIQPGDDILGREGFDLGPDPAVETGTDHGYEGARGADGSAGLMSLEAVPNFGDGDHGWRGLLCSMDAEKWDGILVACRTEVSGIAQLMMFDMMREVIGQVRARSRIADSDPEKLQQDLNHWRMRAEEAEGQLGQGSAGSPSAPPRAAQIPFSRDRLQVAVMNVLSNLEAYDGDWGIAGAITEQIMEGLNGDTA